MQKYLIEIYYPDIRTECKVVIFLFGLVGGLSFVVGLYGDWKIHEGVKSVKNSTEDAVDLFNSIKNETDFATNTVSDANRNVNQLNTNLQSLANKFPGVDLKQYAETALKISETLNNANNQIISVKTTIISEKTTKIVNDLPDEIKYYGDLFCIIALAVLLVLALIGLIFTFAICSRCLLGCFTVLAVIAFIVTSIIVGATFGTSVGVSDFCVDGDKWIRTEIGDKDISDYIECVGGYNVVSKYLTEATNWLNEAKKQYNGLTPLTNILSGLCENGNQPIKCDSEIINSIESVKTSITSIEHNVDSLIDMMTNFTRLANCQRISYDIEAVMSSVCMDAIKGIVMIFFNTIASSVCFAILVFSATFALR